MDCLLEILGTLGALLIAAIVWVIWFYKRRINHGYLYGLAASINSFPGRVTLRKLEPFHWSKADRGAKRVQTFHDAGFQDISGYSLEELPCARVFVLWHPEKQLVGMVHENQELGTWSDVALFRKGQTQPVLASSILKHAHFYLLPGDPKIHKSDAEIADLMSAVQQARDSQDVVEVVTTENFPALFEKAFAEATDARLLNPLEDYEIRKLVMERGSVCQEAFSDRELEQVKRLLPGAIENELRLVCSAQFLREAFLPASEWQQARGRLLVVHDRTPLRALAGRLIYGAFQTKHMRELLRELRVAVGTPREMFEKINARLPAWQRYKKLGHVTRPVPADIYRAPMESSAS
jgi:hypothetical protein